jgi:hypothetical protein
VAPGATRLVKLEEKSFNVEICLGGSFIPPKCITTNYSIIYIIAILLLYFFKHFGPSKVRVPAVGVAHAGGERSVHY